MDWPPQSPDLNPIEPMGCAGEAIVQWLDSHQRYKSNNVTLDGNKLQMQLQMLQCCRECVLQLKLKVGTFFG